MRFLWDIVRGAVIGVANIIPGVSGGTMAVSMGIYDRLIFAVSDLFKSFRKSMRTLVPVAIGLALGIVCFTYAIEFLLRNYALPTCMAFMGLILGGVPMLWRSLKKSVDDVGGKGRLPAALSFLILLAVSALLPLISDTGASAAAIPLPVWFLIGVIASATMVIPGVSGSMVLMIMGFYYTVIGQLKDFLDALAALDFSSMIPLAIPLFLFGVGVLLGIFLIAKGIRFLFERKPALTYGGILGLVAGAPVAMLYNTGALEDIAGNGGIVRAGIGLLLLACCFGVVYRMDRVEHKSTER